MKHWLLLFSFLIFLLFQFSFTKTKDATAWIRINQLGYKPASAKVAVWCSKKTVSIKTFQVIDVATNKIVFTSTAGKDFGTYGPFAHTYRLNFSSFRKAGTSVAF